MDVRIGIVQSMKELEVELPDGTDQAALSAQVEEAMSEANKVLWLTDRRGKRIGVPSARIAYVELGENESRTVGFGVSAR